MNCDEFVELVTAYLDGALDTVAEQRFVDHLPECDGCDRYLDQIRRTISEPGHLPADRLDTQVRDHLLMAFRTWSSQ